MAAGLDHQFYFEDVEIEHGTPTKYGRSFGTIVIFKPGAPKKTGRRERDAAFEVNYVSEWRAFVRTWARLIVDDPEFFENVLPVLFPVAAIVVTMIRVISDLT